VNPITLVSASNWQVQTETVSLAPMTLTAFTSTLVFDLQTDDIIMPFLFENLLSFFKSFYNLDCSQSPCTYSGDISKLPSLTLGVSKDTSINIPASVYMRYNSANKVYSLAIKTQSFANDISYTILGWPFLSTYYSVFEKTASTQTIQLYSLPDQSCSTVIVAVESSSSSTLIYLIAVIIVAIIFFAGTGFIIYKANLARKRKALYAAELTLSRFDLRNFTNAQNNSSLATAHQTSNLNSTRI